MQVETKYIELDGIAKSSWIDKGVELALCSNLICLTEPEYEKEGYSPLQWFGTNVAQELAKRGETEVCPLFGGQIESIDDYCYQLCRTVPWGFEMGRNSHAIYDVLLNFETKPKNRIFIWYDCQTILRKNKELFYEIFELMIVAGYLNSIGEATYNYQVNQKNIFMFRETGMEELTELLKQEFYAPMISTTEEFYIQPEYEHVVIK